MHTLAVLGLLLLTAATACAHDIGVTEVTLKELPNLHYQWRVESPGGTEDAISAPQLPSTCDFLPTESAEDNHRLYFFQCAQPLGAADHIQLTWRTELVMITAVWRVTGEARAVFVRSNEIIDIPLARLSASSGNWREGAWRYLCIGVEHILLGVDHLLFVLGILLLVGNVRALVWAITAFTLAHSLTLALSFLGWIQLNSAPVEATIALSILVLAVEVLRSQAGKQSFVWRYPWVVCGGFGLLHGLGFAGALADLGVPSNEIPIALLFFNLGVELGQLVFLAGVMGCFYGWIWLRHQMAWRLAASDTLKTAGAYLIGSLASFWVLERSAAIFV